MDNTTTTDALVREIEALLEADANQTARVEALLAQPLPARPATTRERMDALWAGVERLAAASDALEREQEALSAALDALERDDA